jgi:hypothetical protein
MREQILRLHLPNPDRVPETLRGIAMAAHGLSGGDLLNVCLNAIEAASVDLDPQNWRVTEEMLMAQVRKVQSTKRVHSGRDDSKLNLSLN